MKPNLAAAVELIISLMRTDARNADGANSTAGKIISANLNYYADKLDPILAELGRGAGEIVGHVHVDSLEEIISGKLSAVVIFKEPHEKTAPLFAHPPVAGLAELTDAQLVELFDYIEVARGNAAQKHWASSETMQSWEARRKVVIAKAAREFLGKVE